MKTVSHCLPDETVRQLEAAAAAAQRSRSNLVRVDDPAASIHIPLADLV